MFNMLNIHIFGYSNSLIFNIYLIKGVKMGRIPKAEKEKAIKNLKVKNGK